MNRVSVVLCSYNNASFVTETLESVYRQSLPLDRYEFIFVDDGSTDDTERVVQPYLRSVRAHPSAVMRSLIPVEPQVL